MTYPRIPARQMLRRAALVVALLIGSSTAVAGMSSASMPTLDNSNAISAPAAVVTRVLPSDRAIMLLEGREPANAELPTVFAQGATSTTEPADATPINYCIPCEILV